MSIGEKRERLVIQSPSESVDGNGQPVITWATVATVWASVEFLSGRELEAMQKINSMVSVKFRVNYRADITEKYQATWNSTDWNIHAVLPDPNKFEMTLLASRVE